MTKTHRFRGNKKRNNRSLKGGKTFASDKNVNLSYQDNSVVCDLCKNDEFKETISSLDKSKVRSSVGQAFFGKAAQILDTTSVIIYTCDNCGLCKMIRNKDPIKIVAKEK
jgi:hypothetical protein